MGNKYGKITSELLTAIGESTGFFEWPLEYSEGWRRKQLASYKRKSCDETIRRMERKGLVRVSIKNGRKFLALSKRGRLEKLFIKAHVVKPLHWDGKWRMVIFDIPEEARSERDRLRSLLKKNGFEIISCEYITAPMDVLPNGVFKNFMINNFFKTDMTRIPFKSTSIFVVAKKN